MNGKIGRNDPCWCGSGKKYKKCHLNRSSQSQIPRSQVNDIFKKFYRYRKCYAMNVFEGECGKIINAHSISKKSSLQKIASESNHVLGHNCNFSFSKNINSVYELEEIGLERASTFLGFCSHHDKKIFSPIEDKELTPDFQQCLLLAYRGLIREIYEKEKIVEQIHSFIDFDKGKSIADQKSWQSTSYFYSSLHEEVLSSLYKNKKKLEEAIIKSKGNDGDELVNIVFTLSECPKILVSTAFPIYTNFNGQVIQNIDTKDSDLAIMMLNVVGLKDKGFLILTYLKNTKNTVFINSLLICEEEKKENALTRLILAYTDNFFISPDWWNEISNEVKEEIEKIISDVNLTEGVSKNILVPDNTDYQAIRIDFNSDKWLSSL